MRYSRSAKIYGLILLFITAGLLCLCPMIVSAHDHSEISAYVSQQMEVMCPMQTPFPFESHMIPFDTITLPQEIAIFIIFSITGLGVFVSALSVERISLYTKQIVLLYGSFKPLSHWVELFSKGVLHPKIFA